MNEKEAREIRQKVFDGTFGCSRVDCFTHINWECDHCPACMASHQHFELFGDNGSQVPDGWGGYK